MTTMSSQPRRLPLIPGVTAAGALLSAALTLAALALAPAFAEVAIGARAFAAAANEDAPVRVVPRAAEQRVDVLVGDRPFTSYVWSAPLTKPVLFPVRTSRGALVTRGFPLAPRPGERVDHPHQVGIWFTHGDVNGVDFWNNSDARSAEERAQMGTIRQLAIEEATSGRRGTLRVGLDWLMPDGTAALHEQARYLFAGGRDRRSIDHTSVLRAADRKVLFRDNKEGLFGIRVARALEMPSQEKAVFTDASGRPTALPALSNEGVTGIYTSSEGRSGDAVWGTRARWVALSGRLDGEDVSLLMLDHPSNPGHPSYWHARGYGLFAANPLGARVFSNGKEALDLTLEPGASVRFRHRLLVLSGRIASEQAERAWREFAAEREE